jgi:proteic killer suppression protein
MGFRKPLKKLWISDSLGFYSIRINDQWRIIFKWNAGNAFEAKIIDYH